MDVGPIGIERRGLRQWPRRELLALAGLMLVGAALRVLHQWHRPFGGDEIGSLLCIQKSYGDLVTRFGGWLTMGYYLALLKAIGALAGSQTWVLIVPGLVAGIALVPLTAAVASRVASRRAALVAAALVATNPYLIFHSVQIRSYMLLAALTLAMLLLFLDWCAQGRWRDGVGCAVCGAAALLMHLNAVYSLAGVVVLLVIWIGQNRAEAFTVPGLRRIGRLVLPMVLIVGAAGAAYVPVLTDLRRFRLMWSDTPPTELGYLPELFRSYFAPGFLLLPTLALLLVGLWSAARHARLLPIASAIVTPIVLGSLLGVSHFPWGHTRFLIAALPLLLVLIGEGINLAGKTFGTRGGAVVTALLVAVVAGTWSVQLAGAEVQKRQYPWAKVARQFQRVVDGPGSVAGLDLGNAEWNLTPYGAAALIRFMSVKDWLAEPDAQPGCELIVVNDGPAISTMAGRQDMLGQVQILYYRGATRRAVAAAVLRDLRRSLAGRVEPELMKEYRVTLQLMNALPDAQQDLTAFTASYYECLMRTRRQRFRPAQFLRSAGGADSTTNAGGDGQ